MFRFSLLLPVLGLSSVLHAAALETTCGTSDTQPTYQYCVHHTTGSTNTDLMYFMHGLGESEHAWEVGAAGRQVRAVWNKEGKNAPTVITVSYGPMWFLAAKNASPQSGLYDDFVGRVIPEIEGKVLHGGFGKRILTGESMGGFNAAKLYLGHPEMFTRAVLACPALVAISPYAPDQDRRDYQQRNHVNEKTMGFLLQTGRTFWPTPEAYNADAPLLLIDTGKAPAYPPLHISCGDADDYGFEEGAKLFADKVRAHATLVNWELLKGGHCTFNATSIADFILN